MNTYYIIDDKNYIVDEFESEIDIVMERFESWLNDHGGLKEYLLVQKVTFGKLQVATTIITR